MMGSPRARLVFSRATKYKDIEVSKISVICNGCRRQQVEGAMKKVLIVLGQLTDQDIDWLVGVGEKHPYKQGEALVDEGRVITNLYIILSGKLEVTTQGVKVAEVGSGEIVGELSYLDSRPPNASVIATEDAFVFAVSRDRLESKMRIDTGFAARFYRALGILLADRLRATTSQLATGNARILDLEVEQAGEISPEIMDSLDLAGARFDRMLKELQR